MYDRRLARMLLEPSQLSVVLVGEPVFRLSEALNREFNSPHFSVDVPEVHKTEQIERYIDSIKTDERQINNCVMCLHLPSTESDSESLLGLATRTSPSLLLVEHTAGDPTHRLFADEHFFAFGFRVLHKSEESGQQRALYGYSLSDYKKAPEWLNDRYWAHPQRFDLLE